MDYNYNYKLWLQRAKEQPVASELEQLAGNEAEIKESFSSELSFGTAGIRGKMAAGTARMNIYTVRRATQGLADHINGCYGGGSVAIAYDTRNNSALFALESAGVLAANGISVQIFPDCEPTPVLSYAVRSLHCRMGIMITASHNPAVYNGYKVFGSDGCQITENDARLIFDCIDRLDYFDGIRCTRVTLDQPGDKVTVIGKKLLLDYRRAVLDCAVGVKASLLSELKVAYTPLHGAGYKHCMSVMEEIGVGSVSVVEQQRDPDGNFTTCEYPNPETEAALKLGVELCAEKGCDILLATDPDADRVGVAVRTSGGCVRLTGNEVGALLLDFIIKLRKANGTLPEKAVAVRSLVSTPLVDAIAAKNGVEIRKVLTGFKYIGEQILRLEQKGEQSRYIFGFEESCGYLAGTYVRDKDAQCAVMLLCEMAAYYKKKGKTLCDVLFELYAEFGFYRTRTLSYEFEGLSGAKVMADKMAAIRRNTPEAFAGRSIIAVSDYMSRRRCSVALGVEQPIDLPVSDIVEWELDGGADLIVRPSGTEPKIKVYVMVCESTDAGSESTLDSLCAEVDKLMK